MIVDTSAIMAVLRGEVDAERFLKALNDNPGSRISAGSWVELGAVLSRYGDENIDADLKALVEAARIVIAPLSAEQAEIGRRAYREFGKGHHRARLNFGDCFSYALAKSAGEPLLYKGADFVHTDIASA